MRLARFAAAPLLVALFGACAVESREAGLQLVVASDIAAPQDLAEVGLVVRESGSGHRVLFARRWLVRREQPIQLPATFGVAPDGDTVFLIEVVGYRDTASGRAPFVLASATVRPPAGSVRRLDLPLHFEEWGSAIPGTGGGVRLTALDGERAYPADLDYVRACPFGQTMRARACVNDAVDPDALPTAGPLSPNAGRCLDATCLDGAVQPRIAGACAVPSASPPANVVAVFRVDGAERRIPVPASGWRFDGDRVLLPESYCAMGPGGPVFEGIVASTCAPFVADMPVCGTATSATAPYGAAGQAPLVPDDAGAPGDLDGSLASDDATVVTDAAVLPDNDSGAVALDASAGVGGKDGGIAVFDDAAVVIAPGP